MRKFKFDIPKHWTYNDRFTLNNFTSIVLLCDIFLGRLQSYKIHIIQREVKLNCFTVLFLEYKNTKNDYNNDYTYDYDQD